MKRKTIVHTTIAVTFVVDFQLDDLGISGRINKRRLSKLMKNKEYPQTKSAEKQKKKKKMSSSLFNGKLSNDVTRTVLSGICTLLKIHIETIEQRNSMQKKVFIINDKEFRYLLLYTYKLKNLCY